MESETSEIERTTSFILGKVKVKNEKGEEQELLSDDEISTLINLRYPTTRDLILDMEDKEILYEVIALLLQTSTKATIEFLQSVKDRNEILFQSPLLHHALEQLEVQNELLRNKPIRTKEGYKCPNCGSRRTVFAQKQSRSLDEAISQTLFCMDCQKLNRIA